MVKALKNKPKKRLNAPGDWFQLVEMFDPQEGVAPATPEGLPPVVLPGKLNEIPVVKVPVTVTAAQAQRISEAVQEACGQMPLVITSNVELVKLRRLSEKQAKGLIQEAREKQQQALS